MLVEDLKSYEFFLMPMTFDKGMLLAVTVYEGLSSLSNLIQDKASLYLINQRIL